MTNLEVAELHRRFDALSRESRRLHAEAKGAMHDHVHRIDGKFAQQRQRIDVLAARDTRLVVWLSALTVALVVVLRRRR